jgi:hypothetical protein
MQKNANGIFLPNGGSKTYFKVEASATLLSLLFDEVEDFDPSGTLTTLENFISKN